MDDNQKINPNFEYLNESVPDYRWTLLQGGTRCFKGDTLVSTPKGFKKIKDIRQGEFVYCVINGCKSIRPVVKKYKYTSEQDRYKTIIFDVNNQNIECTYDHKFGIKGKWIKAIELRKRILEDYNEQVCSFDSWKNCDVWEASSKTKRQTIYNETCKGLKRLFAYGYGWKNRKGSQGNCESIFKTAFKQNRSQSQEWSKDRQFGEQLGMGNKEREFKPQHKKQFSFKKLRGKEWEQQVNRKSSKTYKGGICTSRKNGKRHSIRLWFETLHSKRYITSKDVEALKIANCYKSECNEVYDIEVLDAHNYLITKDEILSHNSGKTYSVLHWIVSFCMDYKDAGIEIDIVRSVNRALKATAWKDFEDILKGLGLYDSNNHNKSEQIYKLNGNVINYYGTDDAQKVHGRKRDILYCNEINQIDEDTIDQLAPRTTYRIIGDYNPAIGTIHWLRSKSPW